MKKLVLSLAIASTLGLTACDDETIKDIQNTVAENGPTVVEPARVVFDPAQGIAGLSVPNDLVFQGTQDGTLEIPVADPTNGADPFVAASALDGWSTVQPFIIGINFPEGTSLDPTSALNSSSVRIFETTMGGDSSDADCATVQRGLACKVVRELVFSQDFITQPSGNAIAIVPLQPLKGSTTYVIALTDAIQNNVGDSVMGSTTYELMRQDLATKPMGDASQRGLQAVINSYEKAVVSGGVESESIIYTMAMTTQSTTDVLFTAKSLMVANLQQGIYPTLGIMDTGASVADILAGKIPPSLVPLYSAANFMQGSITLPYYLGVPTAENPMAPVNTWWKGLCDSGAMLAGLAAQNPAAIPAEPVSATDGQCMAISAASGLAAPGLRDLGIDTERNLTRYNPVVKPNAMMPLTVQVTTPDINVVNALRAAQPELGLPQLTGVPEAGWPVVILQHGITSKKEDMLPMTGLLSLYGMSTVAINHPLHGDPAVGGSRGFDLNMDGVDDINASTVSATHYMNLASLLTTRDNLRQSTADILGLRFGLNFAGGADLEGNMVKFDGSQVHFLGHSLGAITGINFMALTNTPLNPAIDPMFRVASNSLAMPGVMIANFLMESGAFGGLVKASLTYQASADFKAYVDTLYPSGASEAELVGVFNGFYASLDPSAKASLDGGFAQFTLIAQTVTGSGDPINYLSAMAATQTPTHLIEVVGNGVDNLSDQVIPNTVSSAPLGGTEGAIALLGLPGVSQTSQGSGAVRFVNGHHGSILDPRTRAESPDPVLSAAATQEMQMQVTGFFATLGQMIMVNNEEVVH